MPLFTYKAKKGPVEIKEDIIEADSQDEAIAKLTRDGYYPIRVQMVSGSQATAAVRPESLFGARVKFRDLNTFTRQLATLIKSGVPILKALNIISEQTENKYLKNIIIDIARQVKEGRMLSEALNNYPQIFPSLYIAMIKSGESSGTLEQILLRITEHREKIAEIRSRIRSALAYPILMLIVALATIIILLAYVVPQLKKVFIQMNQELPLITEILIGVSDALVNYWYLFAGGVVVIMVLSKGVTLMDKTSFDLLKLRLPLVGNFIKKIEINRFARTMNLLLTHGIPILSALEITIPTLGNLVYRNELKKITEDLKNGQPLGRGLKASPYFFPFMVNLVVVGEESGRLDEIFEEISSTYERDINETVKVALSLLEPVMILVLGLIVGFIVFSILLPIFRLDVMG
ncbi:MAG: type II secretion system F family protein [Planctomycetota bacterium]